MAVTLGSLTVAGCNPATSPPGTSADSSPRNIPPLTRHISRDQYPSATDTGYRAAPGYPGKLGDCTGPIESNTEYRFCNFSDGLRVGSEDEPVMNVTFYGCRFSSNALVDANVATHGDNIIFAYSSFEPARDADGVPPTNYDEGYQYGIDVRSAGRITVEHSDFWGWGNAIQFGYSSPALPLIVRDSWFHDARQDGGIDHTDAILSNEGGPSAMVFDHNSIVSRGNTQGLALQTVSHPYDQVTITNNYFAGFGYTVAIGEDIPSTNITFTGNVISTEIEAVYGPLYSSTNWSSRLGNVWRSNRWHITAGSYDTQKTADSPYWLPDGSQSPNDYTG